MNLGDTLARFRVGRSGGKTRVKSDDSHEYLSVEEAAQRVDPAVTRQAVHQWIKRGVNGTTLEAFRVGRAYLVPYSCLDTFCRATGKKLRQ